MAANVKELRAQFKAASWRSAQDVEAFCVELGRIDAGEILKFFEVLGSVPGGDAQAQKVRGAIFSRLVELNPDKGLFVPFVRALKSADPTVRALLVSLIPKVNNIQEHAELCAQLNSPEPIVRQAAATVLRQIGGKTVLQMLTDAIPQAHFQGRVEAVEVLVHTSGHHAIGALQAVLVVGKPQEKGHALKYLGDPKFTSKDTAAALKAISVALNDPVEMVQVLAIRAFGAICSEDEWFDAVSAALDSEKVNIVKAAVESLKRFASPRSIAVMERKIRGGPNAIRLAVLQTLESIATDEVLPPLVEALSHKQVIIRTRAGEVLARLSKAGKIDVARTVMWLLRSRDANVRRMAVEIARSVPDPNGELWPKLLTFLRDADWWVRERVVDALVEMAGKNLTRHVVSYLTDSSDVVRRYAVDVLIRLKDPQALGALVRAFTQDTDWWVREKALEAVVALGDARAVPYVVDIMLKNPEIRVSALQALGGLNATSCAAAIAEQLGDEDPDVRWEALLALQKVGSPDHAPAVRARLQDPNPKIRNQAKGLLHSWNLTFGAEPVSASDKATSALDRLLTALAQAEGDDLILAANRQPVMKRMGKIVPLVKNVLSAEQVQALLGPQLSLAQSNDLMALRDVDFSYTVRSEGLRFRANVFRQAAGMSAVFRIIKGTLPPIESLGLPPVVIGLSELKNGLVLIGGPTGSGKSTTLGALINHINKNKARHIISLEDPIEVVHLRQKSLVNQREIGTHTHSFAAALRATLREDPDVILVGEMRDLATVSFAVTAAETGHLVFGTVHTVAADTSIDRIINVFPSAQQDQVRSMLSESLRAVVCQYLMRRSDKEGRVLALEVMVNNDAIGNMIRKGKSFQIPQVVATSKELGMQSMDGDLMALYRAGKISRDDAYMKARSKKDFEELFDEKKQAEKKLASGTPASAPAGAPGAKAVPAPPARPGGATTQPKGVVA